MKENPDYIALYIQAGVYVVGLQPYCATYVTPVNYRQLMPVSSDEVHHEVVDL